MIEFTAVFIVHFATYRNILGKDVVPGKERSDIFRTPLLSRFGMLRKADSKKVTDPEVPVIPRFELLEKLGEGGMASVFLARQESTGRLVAIKIMARHLQSDSRWADRFLDEARRLAELSHPNIVPVIDWGTHEGVGYIVMEYMKGGDLSWRIKNITVTVRDVIDIIRQVAAGLDFAGEKGYVHRDIKPDNILFREDGSPCILDFGIAKDSGSNTTYSSQGLPIGTGAYMSPEQAQPAGRQLDKRSDLYSLGIVMYQLLAGIRPFEYSHVSAAQAFQMYLFAHVNSTPPPLPDDYSVFQPIVDRLLAKEPDKRFGRGNELRKALGAMEQRVSASLLTRPIRDIKEPTVVLTPLQSKLDSYANKNTKQNASYPSSYAASKEDLVQNETANPKSVSRPKVSDTTLKSGSSRSSKTVIYGSGVLLGIVTASTLVMKYNDDIGFFEPSSITGSVIPVQENLSNPASVLPPVDASAEGVTPIFSSPPQVDIKESDVSILMKEAFGIASLNDNSIETSRKIVNLYSKVLGIDPNHSQANTEIDKIAELHRNFALELISSESFVSAKQHIDFVGSIRPDKAIALFRAYDKTYNDKLSRDRQKAKLLALETSILASIDAPYDSPKASRDKLLKALNLIEEGEIIGLTKHKSEKYRSRLNQRYFEFAMTSSAKDDANGFKEWIGNSNALALTPAQISALSRRYEELETSKKQEINKVSKFHSSSTNAPVSDSEKTNSEPASAKPKMQIDTVDANSYQQQTKLNAIPSTTSIDIKSAQSVPASNIEKPVLSAPPIEEKNKPKVRVFGSF